MVTTLYSGSSDLDATARCIIVLCSLARDLPLTLRLPTEVYKWVQGQIQEFLKGGLYTLMTFNAISLQLLEGSRNPPWKFRT